MKLIAVIAPFLLAASAALAQPVPGHLAARRGKRAVGLGLG